MSETSTISTNTPREEDVSPLPQKPPPARRGLNPKLTARRPYPSEPPPVDEIDESVARREFLRTAGALKMDSARSDVSDEDPGQLNPKAHLMHIGQWVPKEFKVGRPVKFTGMWSCCGNPTKISLYCDSLEARDDIVQQQEMEKFRQMSEQEYQSENKQQLSKEKYELSMASGPTPEDIAMAAVNSEQSSYNAPMLMSWVLKHIHEEQTALAGLALLLQHVQTGEGCQLMAQHGASHCLIKAAGIYKHHEKMQLLIVQCLRQLLDCNYTRDNLITSSATMMRIAFSIVHEYLTSKEHIRPGVQCLMQCSRAEVCRADMMERKLHLYLAVVCQRHSHDAAIIRSILKTFNWVATTSERMILLCQDKAVFTVIQCMKRHMTNADVLGPAMLFLTRAAQCYPLAMQKILRMKAVPLIIGALKALYNNEVLQLEGLKMIQQLSKTSEGWKQIDETRGGWQTVCQGTTLGNALIHDLKGNFHNPGWCIGDTPNMPIVDRSMNEAKKILSLRENSHEPRSFWNGHTLQEYMGLSHGKNLTLAINTDSHDAYFELIKTLDLLPEPGEEKEYWFIRINEYEKSNDIKLEDMLATIMSMKKKEEERLKQEAILKEEAKSATGEDYVKPVYVLGERVTTQVLDAKDVAMEEQLAGINDT